MSAKVGLAKLSCITLAPGVITRILEQKLARGQSINRGLGEFPADCTESLFFRSQ
jgi:hypothetical protein